MNWARLTDYVDEPCEPSLGHVQVQLGAGFTHKFLGWVNAQIFVCANNQIIKKAFLLRTRAETTELCLFANIMVQYSTSIIEKPCIVLVGLYWLQLFYLRTYPKDFKMRYNVAGVTDVGRDGVRQWDRFKVPSFKKREGVRDYIILRNDADVILWSFLFIC